MILAVDAGNSRVKWALHDGHSFVGDGWATLAQIDTLDRRWAQLTPPTAVMIANVAGDGVAQALRALCGRWPLVPHWAASRRVQGGVTNLYDDPSQLGVDRWAAMIGARRLSSRACIVVNAGTAMTVDALNDQGEFLGGIIVPGFDLMHESLAAHAARLSSERGSFTPFPRMTRDAITSGAIQALCGAVDRMCHAMAAAGLPDPELIISGGAGESVARHIGRPLRMVDKLVLEGLVQMVLEPQ